MVDPVHSGADTAKLLSPSLRGSGSSDGSAVKDGHRPHLAKKTAGSHSARAMTSRERASRPLSPKKSRADGGRHSVGVICATGGSPVVQPVRAASMQQIRVSRSQSPTSSPTKKKKARPKGHAGPGTIVDPPPLSNTTSQSTAATAPARMPASSKTTSSATPTHTPATPAIAATPNNHTTATSTVRSSPNTPSPAKTSITEHTRSTQNSSSSVTLSKDHKVLQGQRQGVHWIIYFDVAPTHAFRGSIRLVKGLETRDEDENTDDNNHRRTSSGRTVASGISAYTGSIDISDRRGSGSHVSTTSDRRGSGSHNGKHRRRGSNDRRGSGSHRSKQHFAEKRSSGSHRSKVENTIAEHRPTDGLKPGQKKSESQNDAVVDKDDGIRLDDSIELPPDNSDAVQRWHTSLHLEDLEMDNPGAMDTSATTEKPTTPEHAQVDNHASVGDSATHGKDWLAMNVPELEFMQGSATLRTSGTTYKRDFPPASPSVSKKGSIESQLQVLREENEQGSSKELHSSLLNASEADTLYDDDVRAYRDRDEESIEAFSEGDEEIEGSSHLPMTDLDEEYDSSASPAISASTMEAPPPSSLLSAVQSPALGFADDDGEEDDDAAFFRHAVVVHDKDDDDVSIDLLSVFMEDENGNPVKREPDNYKPTTPTTALPPSRPKDDQPTQASLSRDRREMNETKQPMDQDYENSRAVDDYEEDTEAFDVGDLTGHSEETERESMDDSTDLSPKRDASRQSKESQNSRASSRPSMQALPEDEEVTDSCVQSEFEDDVDLDELEAAVQRIATTTSPELEPQLTGSELRRPSGMLGPGSFSASSPSLGPQLRRPSGMVPPGNSLRRPSGAPGMALGNPNVGLRRPSMIDDGNSNVGLRRPSMIDDVNPNLFGKDKDGLVQGLAGDWANTLGIGSGIGMGMGNNLPHTTLARGQSLSSVGDESVASPGYSNFRVPDSLLDAPQEHETFMQFSLSATGNIQKVETGEVLSESESASLAAAKRAKSMGPGGKVGRSREPPRGVPRSRSTHNDGPPTSPPRAEKPSVATRRPYSIASPTPYKERLQSALDADPHHGKGERGRTARRGTTTGAPRLEAGKGRKKSPIRNPLRRTKSPPRESSREETHEKKKDETHEKKRGMFGMSLPHLSFPHVGIHGSADGHGALLDDTPSEDFR